MFRKKERMHSADLEPADKYLVIVLPGFQTLDPPTPSVPLHEKSRLSQKSSSFSLGPSSHDRNCLHRSFHTSFHSFLIRGSNVLIAPRDVLYFALPHHTTRKRQSPPLRGTKRLAFNSVTGGRPIYLPSQPGDCALASCRDANHPTLILLSG